VQAQGVAAQAMLEAAGAQSALLEKSGGEAAFVQGREGADGVVALDDGGVAEVDLEGGGLNGEYSSDVVRVREGADKEFAVEVVPPAQDHVPAV
jgi:hypothetical protein